MNKGLVFVFFAFFTLVALDLLFSFAGNFLPPLNPNVIGPSLGTASAYDSVALGNFNLFNADGIGKSIITQGYGRTPYSSIYPDDWHDGIDIAAYYGESMYTPTNGVVIAVGNQDQYCYHKAFGKYVALKDPANNLVLWYAHLGTQAVVPGETITKGTKIGTVGATGLETGVHLHFSIFDATGFTMQVREGCGPEPTGQDVDPLNYLGSIYQ
jgi:murein DD-endopeptidase MepM/ murein hydrolase activator NlpD